MLWLSAGDSHRKITVPGRGAEETLDSRVNS